jgi:hypothetical protein
MYLDLKKEERIHTCVCSFSWPIHQFGHHPHVLRKCRLHSSMVLRSFGERQNVEQQSVERQNVKQKMAKC